MRKKILIIILTLYLSTAQSDSSNSKGYFAVTASRLLRPNKPYRVSIQYKGYGNETILSIGIKNRSFEEYQNVTLIGTDSKTIEFFLTEQFDNNYELEVKSITGDNFKSSSRIETVNKKFSVFIQTDKSIYKPADKVQFRVLLLDADTRPFNASKVKIFITDGGDNRVKQFDTPKFTKGVYQNELQLSDLPVMGKWNFHVNVNDKYNEKKEFEVTEYVLPKFEFTIDVNPDANFKDGKIRASVKARYTFGKIAKGNATITAKSETWYGYSNKREVTKTVEVDGKKHVEFDIENELGLTKNDLEHSVLLSATFTEELSGKQQNATAKVQIHITPYEMELKGAENKFKPGLLYKVTAIVKHRVKNAPVTDFQNPVRFSVSRLRTIRKICTRRVDYGPTSIGNFTLLHTWKPVKYNCDYVDTALNEYNVFLKNGVAELYLDFESSDKHFTVEAIYLDIKETIRNIKRVSSKSNHFLHINILTVKPKLNSQLKIEIQSTKKLNEISYQVIGSGNIIESKAISVPNLNKTEFSFKATDEMAPTSQVIVYYITSDGEIISDDLQIEFESDLKNLIDIQLSAIQAKPSADVNIIVNTKEDSFVGLLGVDQSVLILKKGNDIEYSKVLEEQKEFKKFKSSDLIIITNAMSEIEFRNDNYYEDDYDYDDGIMEKSGLMFEEIAPKPVKAKRIIEVRKNFPETWLFDSFELNSNETTKTLSIKAPDTITSWIITGFSVNPTYGLGLTREASTLNVFQPFFVSTNLPYSIKRGEVVAIPFTVFNYMQNDQEVEVKFLNADQEFEFVEVNEEENEVKKARKKRGVELERKKNVFVKSNEGAVVKFMIRSLKVGYITIKVTAESAVAGDGVEKKLLVEPEGVTQYMNKAVLIDLRYSSEFKTSIVIKVPNNTVEDSTRIETAVSGDLLGPSIENLDKLIKLPYGCGEQNMVNFVPNIVVLDYLTSVNKLTLEIEEKAKKHMESGYQRELGYKHNDGSYSAFGKSDSSGSTWLTAFVIKSFNQASKYIEIESDVMNQGLKFLSKTQKRDGSFPEVGHILSSSLQGGSSKGIGLTAYVLTTFLEAHNGEKYKDVVTKGLRYILDNVEELDDNYSLAIASYALQLAKDPTYDSIRNTLLEKLESRAVNLGQRKHWKRESAKKSSGPNSINIEMTSYALLAYLEAGRYADGFAIGKWLITQRNENGGFQSTQDTVVGLQALAKLASKSSDNQNDIKINMKTDEKNLDINVNSDNSLLLQKFELPSNSRHFEIVVSGQGTCLLQIAYRYNVDNLKKRPRFILKPTIGPASHKEYLHLIVCTNFVPDTFATKSNMAVMEMALPSGFTFDTDHIKDLKSMDRVKKVETKDSDTLVIVYFDHIDAKEICPEFKAYRTHGVAKQKPSPIIIYDYYDNSRYAREFYNSPEVSLCDICGDEDECRNSCETSEI